MKKRLNSRVLVTAFSLFFLVSPTQAQIQNEVATPLPSGTTWAPFGGRTTPVSPTGTAEYNFLDVEGRLSQLASLSSTVLSTNTIGTLPRSFGALTGGTNQELQILTLEEAAQFNIPVALIDVDAKYTRKILVKNFIAYKQATVDGKQVRVGAGIRWIMDVATLNANTELSFPVIAAQAQLGVATAKIKIETPGINNDAINAALNVPTEVNVENYFKMTGGFEKAKGLITSTTAVAPEIVEVYVENKSRTDDDYKKAILVSWALFSIAKERSLQEAQEECPIKDNSAKSVIADVYKERTGILSSNILAEPNAAQRELAKLILSGIKVTK